MHWSARHLLEHDGITVVGVAWTSAEALQCFEQVRPGVSLVDVNLGEENGFSRLTLISTHAEQDFSDTMER
jgi:chemotaxis response regulator CheB